MEVSQFLLYTNILFSHAKLNITSLVLFMVCINKHDHGFKKKINKHDHNSITYNLQNPKPQIVFINIFSNLLKISYKPTYMDNYRFELITMHIT